MAETVDTAASLSPADGADKSHDASSVDLQDEAEGPEKQDEPEGAEEQDDAEGAEEEAKQPEDARSVTELLEQLGRDLSELGVSEAQLEAARNMPEVRRASRDIASTLVVVVAALTAFAFLNVAALDGLSKVLATWLAALLLAALWIALAGALLLSFRRARKWLSWIVLRAAPPGAVEELERERNAAGKAALDTLEQLGPALATQIALAAVPEAGDVASGVVEVGGSVIEASDEIVEQITEEIPGGGVVNQVWDVALRPGRFGIKVVTTVLRRGSPPE
jgi:hypothetical protein